jgi:hypothetical protein
MPEAIASDGSWGVDATLEAYAAVFLGQQREVGEGAADVYTDAKHLRRSPGYSSWKKCGALSRIHPPRTT